jgi:16S rRNA (guanine966-N2)-methyltransferase
MSKPRIISGSAKGRALEVPKAGTRPSPGMLRQALFNILEFRERGTFLDLFSGSGAIGLEAASHGWDASCVELSRDAAQVIRKNASRLNLNVKVIEEDALRYIKSAPKFNVVFAAPPYPLELAQIFQAILDADIVQEQGIYVFQHPRNMDVSLRADKRTYGSNALSIIKAAK